MNKIFYTVSIIIAIIVIINIVELIILINSIKRVRIKEPEQLNKMLSRANIFQRVALGKNIYRARKFEKKIKLLRKRVIWKVSIVCLTGVVSAICLLIGFVSTLIESNLKKAAIVVGSGLLDEEVTNSEEEGWQFEPEEMDKTNSLFWGSVGEGSSSIESEKLISKYSIVVDGTSYIYFHQATNCDCTYCGDWSSMQWGTGTYYSFGQNGCAVYSLAMAISNIKRRVVTPIDLLSTLGCTIYKGADGLTYCDTYSSDCFQGVLIVYYKVLEKIKEAYGIESSTLAARGERVSTSSIDDVINKGGFIWTQWKSSTSPWTGENAHFMLIRKYNSTSYYCITSSTGRCSKDYSVKGSVETMKSAWSKEKCIDDISEYVFALWGEPDKSSSETGDWFVEADKWAEGDGVVNIGEQLKMYSSLPWATENGVTVVDMDAVKESIYNYVGSSGGHSMRRTLNELLTYNSCATLANSVPSQGEGWQKVSDGTIKSLDGIYCIGIAAPPFLVDTNYCNNFKGSDWKQFSSYSADRYNYSKMKLALVLERKTDNAAFYLPATTCDAKAHTFPGGAVQTNIKILGNSGGKYHVAVARSDSDASGSEEYWDEDNLSYYINNTEMKSGTGVNYPISYMHSIVEIYGLSKTVYTKLINEYKFRGYVIWR